VFNAVLLDFALRPDYAVIKLRFISWILLPTSGKKGEDERKSVDPLVELPSGLRLCSRMQVIVIILTVASFILLVTTVTVDARLVAR
jgi:hypothetical protein